MRWDGNLVISLRFNRQECNGQEPELRKGGVIDEPVTVLTLQMLEVVLDETVVTKSGLVQTFGPYWFR